MRTHSQPLTTQEKEDLLVTTLTFQNADTIIPRKRSQLQRREVTPSIHRIRYSLAIPKVLKAFKEGNPSDPGDGARELLDRASTA